MQEERYFIESREVKDNISYLKWVMENELANVVKRIDVPDDVKKHLNAHIFEDTDSMAIFLDMKWMTSSNSMHIMNMFIGIGSLLTEEFKVLTYPVVKPEYIGLTVMAEEQV